MKLNTVTCTYFLSLGLLLVSCTMYADQPIDSAEETEQRTAATDSKRRLISDYQDPIAFMSDFLDVAKKPEKPLKYWALQLVLLLRNNPVLNDFCHQIKSIALNKDLNPDQRMRSINNAFIKTYTAQLFSEELSKFIFSQGLGKVRDAIRERAKKVS